ncbi:bifunctional glycosyltransferase 87/phosphatase PAP2 family protein [Streptomyces coffeae]|uniref:Phosphatase PAP2 family protein n=1 Tax=Streptomyces coffeae TaxID=621382 RepID=A0ABS1NJT5_9ACTN|nr:bifunctional glycosyltransferase 87/phosphatase PAP2 family protein [Streptomyces coffeae]MBL1100199.1 phosphatase PAP2 family protein [Streptomyces coffeae]
MVLGALWLLAFVLAARQAAAVLRLPPDERLTDLETWIGDEGVLHVSGSLYDGDAFTGTPFSGLVLKPLTRAAEQSLGVAWTFGTLLLVVALGLVAARALPGPVSRRTSLLAAPLGICLLVLSLPVRNTFTLGQTSIIPVLLVVLTVLPRTSGRQAGVLIGVAAALQPALLLFAVVMWLVGRRRAAALAGATFAVCTALAWALMPRDSWTYWVHHIGGAGLGAPADSLANQSLHGLLLRIGFEGPAELALLALLAVTVAVVGLRRAVRYARDGQLLLATAITGCVALAVSPTSWQYQQLWILPAVVGRVGKRASDRLVWPVLVVLVMSLDRTALLPDIDVLGHIGYNAPLLAALAATCVVPFLSRTSPRWDDPEPTPVAEPAKSRFAWVPLLRVLKRPLSRPNLMLELMLIRVGYFAYSWIRGHAPGERSVAEGHGHQVLTVEGWLHIDIEHWFNAIVADTAWLKGSMNWYYSTFHFLIPLSLLGWLYVRRPATYRWARTPLAIATMLALVGFWLYPLAPPRLMDLGFVDTAHGPQDLENPDFGALTKLSNQYAAMPSLHVGWSLWCGVVIAIVAPYVWAKVLGMLYPLLTTAVIVGTANHYVLDAVGGAAVVSAGFGLQYLLLGVGKRPHEEAPPLSATMGAAVARARGLVPGLVPRRGGQHDDAGPVEEAQSAADEPPKGGDPRVELHDQRV